MEFDSKLALVTGAARGIGREVARRLAAGGARVILVDRDADRVEATAAEMRAEGATAIARHADLALEADTLALREVVEEHGGQLHVLVNNAGAWRYGSLLEVPLEDFDFHFAANVRTLWLTLRAMAPALLAADDAHVVNVLSTAAFRPPPDLPLYAAAKAAALSLNRSAALEFARHGVLVNGIAPGPTATEPVLARYPDMQARAANIPVGRVGQPDDLAEVIVFLASPRNRFMCGETVLVNGGNVMA